MTKEKYLEIIDEVGKIIAGTEFENHVFAVGGCVRDMVMGLEIKDVDMCIDLPDGGIRFAEFMHEKKVLVRPPIVYPTYGTAMFKLKKFNQDEIEVLRGAHIHRLHGTPRRSLSPCRNRDT